MTRTAKISTASEDPPPAAMELQPPEEIQLLTQPKQQAVYRPPAPSTFKAPDGGWGWFVVLGSAITHVFIGGTERSSGILYLELQQMFNRSSAITAWVVTLSGSIRLLGGPLASFFSNRFSLRKVSFTGGVLLGLGLLLSSFADSLEYFFFSYSFLGGFGKCLSYICCMIIVGQYFDKRRGIAVGLSTAGVGVGMFVFPPLLEWLFQTYAYFGAMILLSGISLNLCVCSMLYRPVEDNLVHPSSTEDESKSVEDGAVPTAVNGTEDESKNVEDESKSVEGEAAPAAVNGTEDESKNVKDESKNVEAESKSVEGEAAPAAVNGSLIKDEDDGDVAFLGTNSSSMFKIPKFAFTPASSDPPPPPDTDPTTRKAAVRPSRISIAHSNTYEPISSKDKDCCVAIKKFFVGDKYTDKTKVLLNFNLLKDLHFCMFLFSITVFTLAYQSVPVFIPALAIQKGVSEMNAAILMSVSGATDFFSRIFLSTLLDTKRIKPYRRYLYTVIIGANVIVLFMYPLAVTFTEFASISAVYGVLSGGYVSQKSIIIVDLLGSDKLSSSFGWMACFQGIGSVIGPPVAGKLKDVFDTYDPTFYFAGAMVAAGCVCLAISNVIYYFQQQRLKAQSSRGS